MRYMIAFGELYFCDLDALHIGWVFDPNEATTYATEEEAMRVVQGLAGAGAMRLQGGGPAELRVMPVPTPVAH